jgi:hypothetical protein
MRWKVAISVESSKANSNCRNQSKMYPTSRPLPCRRITPPSVFGVFTPQENLQIDIALDARVAPDADRHPTDHDEETSASARRFWSVWIEV